jgi:hypothetical protein
LFKVFDEWLHRWIVRQRAELRFVELASDFIDILRGNKALGGCRQQALGRLDGEGRG